MQTFIELWTQLHNLIGPVSDVIGALYVLAVVLSGVLALASKLYAPIGKALPWLTAVALDLSKARDWLDARKGKATHAAKNAACFLLLGAAAYSQTGCTYSFEEAHLAGQDTAKRMAAPPPTERCISLDNNQRTWTAIAEASAALGGGSGLAIIPVTDKTGRIVLAVTAAGLAALAAASGVEAAQLSASWVRECSQ
jgi:hypothetical protein